MATMLNDGPVTGKAWETHFHPHDPADFERCVGLLDAVPEFRERLGQMKVVSKYWAVLVDHWDEIEILLNEEVKQRFAPKTYDLMKELFKLVEAQND